MGWASGISGLGRLDRAATDRLETLVPSDVPAGTVLFRPGEAVQGYAIVLTGKINVSLTGITGREILLYSVAPGQSCIQSTMGLIGGTEYSAEAVTEVPSRLVLLPKGTFLDLLNTSAGFRGLVFQAFAERMQSTIQLLEKVAFQRVECRLAEHVLALSTAGPVIHKTQADLAAQVGTAREVVSRRLEAWSRHGWVKTGRGTIEILDHDALRQVALSEV